MKNYIIYVKGIEKGYLKAANHNAAQWQRSNYFCNYFF